MTACVLYCGIKFGEEVVLVPQRVEHAHSFHELEVLRLDALDEHGHRPPFKTAHELGDHASTRRVEGLQLRHPDDDDTGSLHLTDAIEQAFGSAEKEGAVDAKQCDAFIARLRDARQLFAVHPRRA